MRAFFVKKNIEKHTKDDSGKNGKNTLTTISASYLKQYFADLKVEFYCVFFTLTVSKSWLKNDPKVVFPYG